MKVLIILSITFLLSLLLIALSMFFIESSTINDSSDVAFECGFEPYFFSRIPFCIHFYSISMIFMLFDLELAILLPLVTSSLSYIMMSIYFTIMVVILIMGLVTEWFDGSIDWAM